MKKLILLSVLVLVSGLVFGQAKKVFYTTGPAGILRWTTNATWTQGDYSGPPMDLADVATQVTNTTAAGRFPGVLDNKVSTDPNAGVPDIVVIRSGHHLQMHQEVAYNGYIILETGATLEFVKTGGSKGRLTMNGTSVIEMRANSFILATSAAGNNDNSLWLVIGDIQLKGDGINFIPDPTTGQTLFITVANLGCLGTSGSTAAGCPPGPISLPVELTAFTARALTQEVVLSWTAQKEWNFSHYEVEWSTDAVNFTIAGTLAGRGTEAGAQQYTFEHTPGQSGTIYYRLLGVDIDGTVEAKGVRAVRFGAEVFGVYVQDGRLLVNYNGPAESKLTLYDTSGRLISNGDLTAEGLEISKLKPGLYLVNISNSFEKKTQRVIIR